MTPLLTTIVSIAEKFIPDPDKKREFQIAMKEKETELEKQFLEYAKMDHQLRLKEIEHTGFKSYWRPALMFTFGAIIALYALLYYILPAILIHFPSLDYVTLMEPPKIEPAFWDLVKYSILGIGGMRTVDKWRNK